MTPLEVERSRSDGYVLLTVEGELDIATAPRMIAALNEVLADMDVPLVVDLSDVVFMDSTGLALLMNARRRAMRNGQGFAIVCPDGPISPGRLSPVRTSRLQDPGRAFRALEAARFTHSGDSSRDSPTRAGRPGSWCLKMSPDC